MAVAGGARAKGGDGGGSPVGVVRDDGKTKGVLAPEDMVAVSGSSSCSRSVKKVGSRELGGAKVDAADEAELVSAVREAVGRAQGEINDGESRPNLVIEESRAQLLGKHLRFLCHQRRG